MWRPSDCPIKNSSFLHEPCHWRKRVSTRNPSILHRQTPTLHVPSNHRDFFGSNLTTSFTESHHRVLRVWPRLGRGCFLSRWLDIFFTATRASLPRGNGQGEVSAENVVSDWIHWSNSDVGNSALRSWPALTVSAPYTSINARHWLFGHLASFTEFLVLGPPFAII